MTRCPTAKIRAALANGQIMSFDETSVEGIGILRIEKCLFQVSLRAEKKPAINPNYLILPTFFDDLAVNTDP